MERRYFIMREGRQAGPYTKARLRELRLDPQTRVWVEERFDWVRADSVAELSDVLAATPAEVAEPGFLRWLFTARVR